MASQKKQYRSSTNRSRGDGYKAQVHSPTPKDYSKQVRSHHGSNTDEVQDALAKQIANKKKFG